MYEDGLVALQAKAARSYGAHDVSGHYAKDPAGSSELDLEQDLLGTVRLASRLELGGIVPLVETIRRASGTSDSGVGIGDVGLVARYDLLRTHEKYLWPGVTLIAGVTFPTGKPADKSVHVLAADSTGTGAFQGTAGVLLEEDFGTWFLVGAAYVSQRTPRTVAGVKSQLGTQGTFSFAVGRSFLDDSSAALFIARTIEGDTKFGDETAEGRSLTSVGFTVLHPFTDVWRGQLAISANPPFDGWGKNQFALGTFAVMIARAWS
ncbi:MAG: hypothetical protein ACXWUG_16185 [Polyangiales bacterium]